MGAEPKETMAKYQQDLYEKFEWLSKEELIQKMISYEFGKLLKKYANVEDLNLSEFERGEKRRGEDRMATDEAIEYTTFSVNVGREDGFTPRDLMAIINANAPRKGLQIGSIRIFDTNTKFEVDIQGVKGFKACFRNVNFNGLPFTLTEVKDRYNRGKGEDRGDRGRGREREQEFGGKRSKSASNSKWRTEKRRNEGSTRERFGEKKKGKGRGKEKSVRRR
jgi:ATP-dependent RNA helicase DeaD